MSQRAQIVLVDDDQRRRAMHWCRYLPAGTRVDFKGPLRSIPQNSRQWAMLTDVSTQLRWHGRKLSPSAWKLVFMSGLRAEMDLVPNFDGTGFINIGTSSSDLSTEEHTDFTTLILMFGDKHSVLWSDPKEVALREMEYRAPLQIEHKR